jgi:hypothetical protein
MIWTLHSGPGRAGPGRAEHKVPHRIVQACSGRARSAAGGGATPATGGQLQSYCTVAAAALAAQVGGAGRCSAATRQWAGEAQRQCAGARRSRGRRRRKQSPPRPAIISSSDDRGGIHALKKRNSGQEA